jgi:hypothetical protein
MGNLSNFKVVSDSVEELYRKDSIPISKDLGHFVDSML